MNLPFYVAKRYLFSKKSTNAINIISGISMLGVLIASAALIIVLSVFNGFTDLVLSLYSHFTPDVKIEAAVGKTFNPAGQEIFDKIKQSDKVKHYVEVLEQEVMLKYMGRTCVASVKGVSESFPETGALDTMISRGALYFQSDSLNFGVYGSGLEYILGLSPSISDESVTVYAPRKQMGSSIHPESDLNRKELFVAGVFQVQQEFDSKYVLSSLKFVRELREEPDRLSSVELYLQPGSDISSYVKALTLELGDAFTVKDRFEQNQTLYKIFNSEKLSVYLILTFVLIIAICNIVGSLTMLVIDKRKDIAVLISMGASSGLIRAIFFLEGMLISLIGSVIGILSGACLCLLQQKYGWIKMNNSGTFVIDTYPIKMHPSDFILVFGTVLLISFIAALFASGQSVKKLSDPHRELVEN